MTAPKFHLLNYKNGSDQGRAAILVDGRVLDVLQALTIVRPWETELQRSLHLEPSTLAVLAHWDVFGSVLADVASRFVEGTLGLHGMRLEDVELLAPVLYPGAIYCAGANYRDHVEEMSRAMGLPAEPDPHEIGLKPWHFLKAPITSVRGPGEPVALPAYSKQVDWEAEVALVIGREARNVDIEDAMKYVAGFTIVNDLSARDHLKRHGIAENSPFRFDWIGQKCFDGSCPMGPWITPVDHIEDASRMKIQLWLNDEIMQDSSTDQLIFTMAEQVSHLSMRVTLRPGDVIATGTPAGVGMARGRFLAAGDSLRIVVDGIGELVTPIKHNT